MVFNWPGKLATKAACPVPISAVLITNVKMAFFCEIVYNIKLACLEGPPSLQICSNVRMVALGERGRPGTDTFREGHSMLDRF
jgi:hypothetical protein